MASERQITANRRNARKSSGPRSAAGKKRASRNAYRHGLTLGIISTAAHAKQLDELVRKIADNTDDITTLQRAREIALATLDIERARQAKVSLIQRVSAFGELEPSKVETVNQRGQFVEVASGDFRQAQRRSMPMPSQEPERSAEAVRRVLPELRKLDRYERRAAARRDRAVLHLKDRELTSRQSKVVRRAKRSQFY